MIHKIILTCLFGFAVAVQPAWADDLADIKQQMYDTTRTFVENVTACQVVSEANVLPAAKLAARAILMGIFFEEGTSEEEANAMFAEIDGMKDELQDQIRIEIENGLVTREGAAAQCVARMNDFKTELEGLAESAKLYELGREP